MYRQGDVLLVPVNSIPTGVKLAPAESGRVVLAHGEATGHHHSFKFHDRIAMFREDGTGMFLSIGGSSPALLEHQEHSTIPIPAGNYRVIRQREYAPDAIRNVAD